jgi:subtilisin family serine protease
MLPLELVNLTALMERTSGGPDVKIGLIDGPVVTQHADLASQSLREIRGRGGVACTETTDVACQHGTFVAGILSARRNSQAPAICPSCTVVICPIFAATLSGRERTPAATSTDLAAAIVACVDAGVRLINLSLEMAHPSKREAKPLQEALNHAMRHGVIVIAAAGNQGGVGSSLITSHPWVIPVVACDHRGRPMSMSNLGASIGRRGLSAPGEQITSLSSGGGVVISVPYAEALSRFGALRRCSIESIRRTGADT